MLDTLRDCAIVVNGLVVACVVYYVVAWLLSNIRPSFARHRRVLRWLADASFLVLGAFVALGAGEFFVHQVRDGPLYVIISQQLLTILGANERVALPMLVDMFYVKWALVPLDALVQFNMFVAGV